MGGVIAGKYRRASSGAARTSIRERSTIYLLLMVSYRKGPSEYALLWKGLARNYEEGSRAADWIGIFIVGDVHSLAHLLIRVKKTRPQRRKGEGTLMKSFVIPWVGEGQKKKELISSCYGWEEPVY